jgi:hypothetical protein
MQIIRVNEDSIIWEATLNRRGVLCLTKKQDNLMVKACKKFGLTIKSVCENYETTTYELIEFIEEEQAEEILDWIRSKIK